MSWAERTIAVIEAKIQDRLTADLESYQIAGRAVSKIQIAELKKIRGQLLAEIARALASEKALSSTLHFRVTRQIRSCYQPSVIGTMGYAVHYESKQIGLLSTAKLESSFGHRIVCWTRE